MAKKSMSIAWHDICNKEYYAPIEFGISHQPAATVRIQGDGKCFFRALAFVITGSQDESRTHRYHNNIRNTILEFYNATLMLMKQWMNILQEPTYTVHLSGLQKLKYLQCPICYGHL